MLTSMNAILIAAHEPEPAYPPTKAWFLFMALFLLIDYGRPQDSFSFIESIRPALLVTVVLFLYILRNIKLIPRKFPQISAIWLFILILALHIPFAVNNRWAYNATYWMFLLMPFILSCLVCLNNIARFKKFLIIALCLIAYQALTALTHGGRGIGSTFGDENDLALALNTWLPFCFTMFLVAKRGAAKFFFGTLLLLIISAIIVSFSRGGFFGLIAMLVVFWLFSPRKKMTLGLILLGAATIILVANMTSEGTFSHQKKTSFWEEMTSSTDSSTGTAKERMESWKAAWRMFLANPLGVGGNNFPIRFSSYQNNDYFKRAMWGRVAHSLWFTLLPETGIPGTFIYLLLVFLNFKTAFSLRKPNDFLSEEEARFFKLISVAFIASFAGFFSSATFLSVLYYPHYWYLTALLAAAYQLKTSAKNAIESKTAIGIHG